MSRLADLHGTLQQAFGQDGISSATTRAPGADLGGCSFDDLLPAEGDVVGGLYRLRERLGEGMFGRAYVAERTDVPEHKVALKVMVRAVYAERNVERELVMLAAASHPHVVQLKDHGMTDHYVWLTMPLFEGETLASRLERGTLGLREAYEIFVPITRGIQALHTAGLRHQDVKPENIYLARFADRIHPVLLDLGVAVEQNAPFVAGTVLYGAPEQVMALGGHREGVTLGPKMDTYGLAATLLRSLVGPEHFPGEVAETPFELASAFIERETQPLHRDALPGLTDKPRKLLEEALRRWLAYQPEDRSTSAEMAEQLDVLLEQEREVDAEIERGLARQKASLRRFRLVVAGMLLCGIGAAGFAYSKRQTLRLATELERARAEGAESFDKLDTCVAAQKITHRRAAQCASGWEEDKREFKATLDELSAEGDAAQAAMARRLGRYTAQLRTCEEDSRKAADEWGQEKKELQQGFQSAKADWTSERSKLVDERDAHRRRAKTCQATVSDIGAARAECQLDLASCIQDRDTCMTSAAPAVALPTAPQSELESPPAAEAPSEESTSPSTPGSGPSNPGPPAAKND
ncbi:MAG: protein kinase [Deltaproteobacteria bacterium]|jgi:transposase-like protein|nr:protein kinase [Deltaproteobacteria bacterium]MBW2534113.1 protein kinase [Deltaproteobacteria bacterium]